MTIRTVTGNIKDLAGVSIPNATFSLLPETYAFGSTSSEAIFGDLRTIVADGSGDVSFDLHEGKYIGRISTSQGAKSFRLTVDSEGPWTLGRLIGELDNITSSLAAQIFDARDEAEAAADLSQAWAESDTPPDPDDTTSRSAKSVAETLGTLSELETLADRGETAATLAETARDSSFANAKGAATIEDARALVADNETFIVYADGAETFDAYRRLTSSTQEFLGSYPSSLVAGSLPQNIRTTDFLSRSIFRNGEVSGALGLDLETVAHSVWSVDGTGAIDMTGSLPTSAQPRSFWAGHRHRAGQALEIETEIELESGFTSTHGPMIALGGDGNTVMYVLYTETGLLTLLNTSMVNVMFHFLPDAMQFTHGQRPRLRLLLLGDGTGIAEAISPTGERARLRLTGLPTAGKVCAAWRRAPSAGKITAFSVRPYVENLPAPDAPVVEKLGRVGDTLRSPVTGNLPSTGLRLLLDGAKVNIINSNNSLNHLTTGFRRTPDAAWEIYIEAEVTSASGSAAGCIIAIGDKLDDSSARRTYCYLENGTIGRLDNASAAVDGESEILTGYAVNEIAALRLVVYRDNTGYIEGITPAGLVQRQEIENVPSGAVHVGWRSSKTGIIHRVLVAPFPDKKIPELIPNRVLARGSRNLPTPDVLAGRVPSGFTCTGGDIYDFGPLSGLVVLADDGRLIEFDGSPFNRALHFLTPVFGRVVKTLTLPNPTQSSTQGVAIDRGLAPGTLWVAHTAGDNRILHYQAPATALDGTSEAAVEITADAIEWSSDLGLSNNVNGVAYDSDHGGALWASSATASFAVQIDVVAKTVLRTLALGQGNPDHLQFLSALSMPDGQARLLYTTGSNGSNGTVHVYNLTTDEDAPWTVLPGVTAIEQFFYDPASNVGWASSDDGFHPNANSDKNRVLFFEMPRMPV